MALPGANELDGRDNIVPHKEESMHANQQNIADDVLSGRIAMIGSRTDDPSRRPIAKSTPSPCAECKANVMLSPASRRRMTELSVVLCVECAVAVAESRNEPWIYPGRNDDQLQEMKANGIEPK